MKPQEINALLVEAGRLFPSIAEYTHSNPGMISVWAEILEGDEVNAPVTLADAMSVLSRWKMGTLVNPPVGFRRELFATEIRAVVGMDRSKANEAWLKSKERAENKAKYERKKDGNPAFVLCAPLFDRILDLNRQVINGTMSQHERDWKVHDIVNEMDDPK